MGSDAENLLSRRKLISGMASLGAVAGVIAAAPSAVAAGRDDNRSTRPGVPGDGTGNDGTGNDDPASDGASNETPASDGASDADSAGDDPAGDGESPKHPATQFTLTTPDVTLTNDGDTSADLFDAAGGAVGSFASVQMAGALATLTFHVFELTDGSLFAMGTGPVEQGTFAVTGGTGRYRAARGSYDVTLSPSAGGGDGSGSFVFDLTLPEEG